MTGKRPKLGGLLSFAGTRPNGEVAPKAVVHCSTGDWLGATQSGSLAVRKSKLSIAPLGERLQGIYTKYITPLDRVQPSTGQSAMSVSEG
jgi:hypothetical protein